jgi:hypothetical protein
MLGRAASLLGAVALAGTVSAGLPPVRLDPAQAPPGSVLVCRLDGPAPEGAVLAGFRQEAGFYISGGHPVALLAVPLGTRRGRHALTLRWQGGRYRMQVKVLRDPYPRQRVRGVRRLKRRLRQAAADDEAGLIAGAVAQSGGPPRWLRQFRWPLDGGIKVTSPFGARRRYNDGSLGWRHKGMDLRASEGTAVLASADGVVLLAKQGLKATGGTVIVDHGYGVTTGYFHLARIDVSPGAPVRAGQGLGLSGASGIASGPHLHFQIDLRGFPVDPGQWLGAAPSAPPAAEKKAP